MKVRFQFLGVPIVSEVTREGDRLLVPSSTGGAPFEFRLEGGDLVLWRDGAVRRLPFARVKDRLLLHLDGKVWEFVQAEPGFAAKAGTAERFDGKVYPPMPGNVVKVMVKAGDAVEKGAPLVIIESMKMEHTVEAPEAGTVLEVRAVPGTVADLTAPMVVMEAAKA